MKINGNSINAVSAYIHTSAEAAAKKTSAASGRKKSLDRVEFSKEAMASLERSTALKEKTAAAVRDARDTASPERIAALRASVMNGSYSVSAEDTASSVLGG